MPSDSEILDYLARHPDAKDTLEGVVEWWVLDGRIRATAAEVKAGLERLLARGSVVADQSGDGRIYYRANTAKAMDGSTCSGSHRKRIKITSRRGER